MSNNKKLLVIVGPTGVGKSKLALNLALEIKGEIVSADSMQVYKGMDIGTAKPSLKEQKAVPHHLIDIVYPNEDYNAGRYRVEAISAIENILIRGNLPILVGGTGLYIKAVLDGFFEAPEADKNIRARLKKEAQQNGLNFLYNRLKKIDPEASFKINQMDRQRIIRSLEFFEQTGRKISSCQANYKKKYTNGYDLIMVGIKQQRAKLYNSINQRVDKMIKYGLIDEVNGLLDKYDYSCHSMQGLGYKHIGAYILGHYNLEEAIKLMKRDTRRFAKRQFTWFNKDSRIRWYDTEEINNLKDILNYPQLCHRHEENI